MRYQVDWHLRLALPVTTAILALLGVAIALHLGHRGGIAVGVGIGIVVAGLCLTALQIGGSLGTAGILPPALAVWSSNVLFGALGGLFPAKSTTVSRGRSSLTKRFLLSASVRQQTPARR